MYRLDTSLSATVGFNETLRERGGGHGGAVAISRDAAECSTSRVVVSVVRVQQTDDDASVKVNYSHSSRRAASSPGA